ncbi:MAG: hypothetical protein MZU91_14925 [Desulfosudis oleivorans]|nr:hypothetical protein [Desulfosudis oleivorans]
MSAYYRRRGSLRGSRRGRSAGPWSMCRGLDRLPARARVFIKPNIVFWTRAVPFPKWG